MKSLTYTKLVLTVGSQSDIISLWVDKLDLKGMILTVVTERKVDRKILISGSLQYHGSRELDLGYVF